MLVASACWLAPWPWLGACADDVPSPSLVEDLRVLAIRAEPPELLLDRAARARPGDRWRSPSGRWWWIPRGGPMVYEWQLLPGGVQPDLRRLRRSAQGRRRPSCSPLLDAARAQGHDRAGGGARRGRPTPGSAASRCRSTRRCSATTWSPRGWGWATAPGPAAVLRLQSGGESLPAQKRVVLNARDLSQWNPELAAVRLADLPAAAGGGAARLPAPAPARRQPQPGHRAASRWPGARWRPRRSRRWPAR